MSSTAFVANISFQICNQHDWDDPPKTAWRTSVVSMSGEKGHGSIEMAMEMAMALSECGASISVDCPDLSRSDSLLDVSSAVFSFLPIAEKGLRDRWPEQHQTPLLQMNQSRINTIWQVINIATPNPNIPIILRLPSCRWSRTSTSSLVWSHCTQQYDVRGSVTARVCMVICGRTCGLPDWFEVLTTGQVCLLTIYHLLLLTSYPLH